MKLIRRILYILFTLAVILLYVPVNRLVTQGSTLKLPIDNLIPVIPIFVVPYLLAIPFWFGTVIYINLKKHRKTLISFDLKMIAAGVFSVFIYLIFPTYVTRPLISSTDLFSNLLNLVYANDRAFNAAPSGHTFFTLLCMITLNKVLPKYKYLWLIISLLIILSTLFTKQHNFLDVIFGIIFALMINYLLNKFTN